MKRYLYMGSPYSLYSLGIHQAWLAACETAGALILKGIPVYSPIAHMHPVAMHGNINPLDHAIWLPINEAMMEGAVGMIALCIANWKESRGLAEELKYFRAAKLPIFKIDGPRIPDAMLDAMRSLCGGAP